MINAADDERNPPENGVTDAALKRVKNGRLFLIPASSETRDVDQASTSDTRKP